MPKFNLKKYAQEMPFQTEEEQGEHTEFLGGPTVHIQPYDNILSQAVSAYQQSSPGALSGVTDIIVDTKPGALGWVSNQRGHTIYVNMVALKEQVQDLVAQLTSAGHDVTDEHTTQIILYEIGRILAHEGNSGAGGHGHLGSLSEQREFVGGEGPAEQAEQDYIKRNPFEEVINL